MRAFIRQLRPAVLVLAIFTLVCGVAYPLVATVVGQVAFEGKADGSLIERDGVVVGSELIGQAFTSAEYFHSRPSAAGAGYDGSASSGSNLGPLNPDLLAAVDERSVEYRRINGLAVDAAVPVDAVTASGSGLDPHISQANAFLQMSRVAAARNIDVDDLAVLVDRHTTSRMLGVIGEAGINVVTLNLALDGLTTTDAAD